MTTTTPEQTAIAAQQPAPGEVERALAVIAADRNQLRIALSRIAMGQERDPSVAADKALVASSENVRRQPEIDAHAPQLAQLREKLTALVTQWRDAAQRARARPAFHPGHAAYLESGANAIEAAADALDEVLAAP